MKNSATRRTVTVPMLTLIALLFGDIAYAVLPILTIAILRLALNKHFGNFLLLPEWSFASIVFFGLSTRQILELKVKYQKDFSEKLFLGPQIFILPLIASVLSLALVELNEESKNMNEQVLIFFQMSLFIMGFGSLIIVNYAKGIEVERAPSD